MQGDMTLLKRNASKYCNIYVCLINLGFCLFIILFIFGFYQ